MNEPQTDKKNIILLTIDCLRADHLHCMGYQKNISPNLDTLGENGVIFTNAFSNGPYTPYSIPSFITSTMPPIEKKPQETIASYLKKNGYATAAFNPNPIVFSTTSGGGMINKGFDKFDLMLSAVKKYNLTIGAIRQYAMRDLRGFLGENNFIYKTIYLLYDLAIKNFSNIFCPKEHLLIPNAEQINQRALEWVKEQKSKFFLWIHYMDVHEPYTPPGYENEKEMLYLITKYRDFPNMLSKEEIKKLIDLYDLTIKYTDKEIQKFLQKLKELNKLENSIIIISADHGDAFAEHKVLGHGDKFLEGELYDELIHVPLIINGSEKKGTIIEKPVQLIDLAPTICELVNIPIPPVFFGKNMFTSNDKGIIINSAGPVAYRTREYKIIINKNKENELYDLKNDPGEKHNIYNINKKMKNILESEMINLLSYYNKKRKLLKVGSSLKKHVP